MGVIIVVIVFMVNIHIAWQLTVLAFVIGAGFILRSCMPLAIYFLLVNVNLSSAVGFATIVWPKLLNF